MRQVTVFISISCLCFILGSAKTAFCQQFNFKPRHYVSAPRWVQEMRNHGFPDTVQFNDMLWSGYNPSDLKVKSVHDMVRFRVMHDTAVVASSYQYRMVADVYGYNVNGGQPYHYTPTDTFTINYEKGAHGLTYHRAYQDFFIKKYSNHHKIMVVVRDIIYVPSDTSQPPVSISTLSTLPGVNCALDIEIWEQGYDKSPYEGDAYPTTYLTTTHLPSEHSLQVNFWDNTSPAPPVPAMYELEWTYIDDYKYSHSNHTWDTLVTSQLNFDFKNNATRIVTEQSSYKIPLIYERGYIVYRARIVRPDSVDFARPVYTEWSIPASSGTLSSYSSNSSKYYFHIPYSHEHDSLNWQYTVSFAEEGKYKQVMSYFDGALKNRQTVTRFNSEPDKLIATENIYDFKGRPAISILPTPVSKTGFGYISGLSVNSATGQPYKAADFDTLQPAQTCPNELSLAPLDVTALANRYYSSQNPDTADFQKYVPDANGYPLVHTLISPEDDKKILKQGGAGDQLQLGENHFTKYDYVVPQQSELNRLFGTEVGRAEFYRKTVVTDPNRQAAFEITDNEGKKMASGMLGNAPPAAIHPVDSMPLPPVSSTFENLLDGIQQTPVSNTWSISTSTFVEAPGEHAIQYILTVPPYPVCGGTRFLTVPASYHYEMFDECGELDTQMSETLGVTAMVSTNTGGTNTGTVVSPYLDKGKHVLNKTMAISYDSIAAAVDTFLANAPSSCLYDENYFIRKEVESRNFPCPLDTLDPCGNKRAKMISELFPGKKYGTYEQTAMGSMDSVLTAATPHNSIFDKAEKFRFRLCNEIQWPDTVNYLGRKYYNIRHLPVDTFIMIFDSSMAAALLPLHPEYCHRCDREEEHYSEFLKSIPDYQTAIQLGYFTLDDIINKDPFYQNFTNYYDSLANVRLINMRIDSICIDLAYCSGVDTGLNRICMMEIFNNHTSSPSYDITTAPALIQEVYWRQLVPLYLGNREFHRMRLQSLDTITNCQPCDTLRLTLTPPPVFGPIITSASPTTTDSILMMQIFTSGNFNLPPWVAGALSSTTNVTQAMIDSAQALYSQVQLSMCDTTAAQMARNLINCSLNAGKITEIQDSLYNFYCIGGGVGSSPTPQGVRRILLNCGISLTDLCNPYLVDYSPIPQPQVDFGGFTCKQVEYYSDLKDFWNSPKVHNSITNQSQEGISLTVGGYFENDLSNALGSPSSVNVMTIFDAATNQYKIEISEQGNPTNKINFWMKKMDQDGLCGSPLNELTTWYIREIHCVKDDTKNLFPSMISRYTFTGRLISILEEDTVSCNVLFWNDSIPVMDLQAAEKTVCLACPEIRAVYDAFKDTLTTYGVCCTDHPYYGWMLSNFLNERMGKQYSYKQIEDFIASCALADSTTFQNLYGQFRFSGLSNATAEEIVDTLNARYNTSVNFLRFKWPLSSSNNLVVWFDNIPVKQLLDAKSFISSNYSPGAYASAMQPDTIAYIFVPSVAATPTLPTGPSGITNHSPVAVSLHFTANASNVPLSYNRYAITQSGLQPHQLVQYTLDLQNYVYTTVPGAQLYTAYNPFVNSDYTLPEKKVFLSYNYGLPSTLKHYELIKKLHEDSLSAFVYTSPSYNNPKVTYTSPDMKTDYSNLFITNNNQSSHPGFVLAGEMLSEVINWSGNTLTNGIFFTAPSSHINIGNNSGSIITTDNLKVYRCGDNKTFWFRLFKGHPSNQLYNLYLKVPDYVQNPAQLTYHSMSLEQGDGNIYRVKVRLNGPNSTTVFAHGYTDFPVGTGKMLENSLLCRSMYDPWDILDTMTCERYNLNMAIDAGKVLYQNYIDSIRQATITGYIAHLEANVSEELWMRSRDMKYHFTLYYYDRAGNLTRVVPPAGVNRLDTTDVGPVNTARQNDVISTATVPNHSKSTTYKYNSLDKVTSEISPDGGTTLYFYDAVGRIVFSQSAAQRSKGKVGYVLYDEQGRIIETGQGKYTCISDCEDCETDLLYPVYNSANQTLQSLQNFILSKTREEVAATRYDDEDRNLDLDTGMTRQTNLRKRVSALKYFEKLAPGARGDTAKTYDFATHYSYDIGGNTKTMTHEFRNIPIKEHVFKRIDYDYDMLSGKVNMLSYNRGFPDQYYHRYTYDADNRITRAETSPDGIYWDDDADYQYYQHGPLARAMLGDLRLQATDFAYTIQGWIKAMNSDVIKPANDMGQDGTTNSIFLEDVFGYSLSYFNGDYSPIGQRDVLYVADTGKSLYNGNIARQVTSLKYFDNLRKAYRYDPLNRLTHAQYYSVDTLNNNALTAIEAYKNSYKYDADGNLEKLMRKGAQLGPNTYLMDSLTYQYGQPNNWLTNVYDDADQANHYSTDIAYNSSSSPASTINYDASGRVISDLLNNSDSIGWSMYNKMKHLKVSADDLMTYAYDGAGNRVQQTKTHMFSDGIEYERLHDYYVRDNSGNILAILNYREHLTQKWNPHEPLSAIYGDLGVTPYSVATIYANDANFVEGVIEHSLANESVASSMINAWEATDYFNIKHAYKWDRCLQRRIEILHGMYEDETVLPIVALALRTHGPSALADHFFSDPERVEIAIGLWQESEGSAYNNFLYEMNAGDGAELMNLYEEDPISFKERLAVFLSEVGDANEYQFVARWLTDTELNHSDIGSEQGQWWDLQWQALDLRLSDPGFESEAPLVDEYFANEDGALGLLREDAGDATLLRTRYLADQSGFLDNYITELGDEAIGIALKNVPGLTAAKLLKTVTGDLPEPTLAGYYEEYLLGESFHLAEHHFYGNKRLGIKYYWPATGWGWDASTGYIPYLNTWITSRVPWYSRAMNEFIQPDITEPRYNKLDYSSWFSSRLLGTKRFELTDHLGNVSSVILDRKTPVNTGSVLHKYDPDVQLVLDYYPYGMVMKEGYCDTCDPNAVTQSTGPALKMVNTDYTLLPQNYPPLTGSTVANWSVVTGGEAEPQEEGQLSWEGTGGGMLFTCLNEVNAGNHELGLTAMMEVTAEEAHEIEIVVDIDDAGELEAKIISYTDEEHTEYDVLTSTKIPTSNGYLLQFTPTTDTVWLWIGRKAEHGFASGTKFKVTGTTTAKTTWTVYQMNIQGLLHSWRSPYRFAYNGQERVDDIKGKTNHNTALYGEYDTRRAWRWNRDPKPNPSISPYAMYAGNPIQFSDVLLDTIKGFTMHSFSRDGSEAEGEEGITSTNGRISMKSLVSTKEGRNFLGQFATKGQTIEGYTFKKDGKYSKYNLDIMDVAMDREKGNNPYTDADASFGPNIVDDKLTGFKLTLYTFRGDGFAAVENVAHEAFIHGWKVSKTISSYESNGVRAARSSWNDGEAGHRSLLLQDTRYEGFKQYNTHNQELMSAYPKLAPMYHNYLKQNYNSRYAPNYQHLR